MKSTMTTITSELMSIRVNSYLVQTEAGFFLIDTGLAKRNSGLIKALESAGVRPGNLKLIILTHGDSDHTGNAYALRQKFGAQIAMHYQDVVNVESGNMFANKAVNPIAKGMVRVLFALTGLGDFTPFTPDLTLEDGQDLAGLGWQARVLHLPGHSKGSIGILTAGSELFCGDLFENTKKPAINSLGDDRAQMLASSEKLKGLEVGMVYPGHGKPFLFAEIYTKEA